MLDAYLFIFLILVLVLFSTDFFRLLCCCFCLSASSILLISSYEIFKSNSSVLLSSITIDSIFRILGKNIKLISFLLLYLEPVSLHQKAKLFECRITVLYYLLLECLPLFLALTEELFLSLLKVVYDFSQSLVFLFKVHVLLPIKLLLLA
jgi:hypothetical protein